MRWIALATLLVGCGLEDRPMTEEQLGGVLFHDPDLSNPPGQACADCHSRDLAFADPEDERASQGVVPGRFGFRNAQPAMYASFSPPLHHDPATGRMVGGLFWDGRASTLEEQALIPFLNPLEMNQPDRRSVVERVRRASYAPAFLNVYGPRALDDVDQAFERIGRAIAAFERTPAFAPFSSRYDRYLAGEAVLTEAELRGLAIFEDPARGNCASCHPSRPSADGTPPLFTDFAYANIGLPRWHNAQYLALPRELNPDGEAFVDKGLGTTTGDPAHDGMFRTPSLRNVARTGPYGHNGFFRGLDEMIEFHATRDVGSIHAMDTCNRIAAVPRAACAWPDPEIPRNVERARLGNLPITDQDIADLVGFLETLTDAGVSLVPIER
jgi:cytochrome c peroxidase